MNKTPSLVRTVTGTVKEVKKSIIIVRAEEIQDGNENDNLIIMEISGTNISKRGFSWFGLNSPNPYIEIHKMYDEVKNEYMLVHKVEVNNCRM